MNRRFVFLLLTLATIFVILNQSQRVLAEEIYVRNKTLQVTANGVNFPKLLRLLSDEERGRVEVLDGRVRVTSEDDSQATVYELGPGVKFSQWEEFLASLGYARFVDSQTGIVDFHTPNPKDTVTQTPTREMSEAAKLSLSRKRPGYRQAEHNYKKSMRSLRLSKLDGERERVQRLGQLIVRQSPLSDLHWTFEVVDSPIPNAFCTGEGFVVVTEGLLDLNLTDDELAGVLGHEVAHGVRRHTMVYRERYTEYIQLAKQLRRLDYKLRDAQQNGDERELRQIRRQAATLQPRWAFVTDYLKNKQSYNRHEEEEADVLGVQYAEAAGFDAMGEGRALIKLKKRSVELFGQGIAKGSRTHPSLKRRLQILNLVLSRRNQNRKVD